MLVSKESSAPRAVPSWTLTEEAEARSYGTREKWHEEGGKGVRRGETETDIIIIYLQINDS